MIMIRCKDKYGENDMYIMNVKLRVNIVQSTS